MPTPLSPTQHFRRALIRLAAALDRWLGDGGGRWTAAAYDRCLLVALLYPVSAIFVLWAATGEADAAATAFGLPSGISAWHRVAAIATLVVTAFALWRGARRDMDKAFGWFGLALVAAIAAAVAFAFVSLRSFAVAIAIGVAFGGAVEAEFAGAYVVAGVVAGTGVLAAGLSNRAAFAVVAVVVVADILLETWARHRGRQGYFLAATTAALLIASFAVARYLAAMPGWTDAAPVLLFLGLLTLVGAVVDWLVLGATRALMPRAIAANGLTPYQFALIGIALNGAAAALLGAAIAGAAYGFERLAASGGGTSPIVVAALLHGVAAQPDAPANWWIYAMLSQAALPGLVLLALALWSIVRGAPYLVALFFNYRPREP